jgi:hypothetical protein
VTAAEQSPDAPGAPASRWRSRWELARSGPVVRRALAYAVVVGSVLAAINHGDALLRAELGGGRLARIGLTYLVPYLVSTFSSVGALLQNRQSSKAGAPSP